LLKEGIIYGNAHHAHANTETIVGHAAWQACVKSQ